MSVFPFVFVNFLVVDSRFPQIIAIRSTLEENLKIQLQK